jgi:nudix-type nucleoside diphosphatase (YffH/AdpP family)
MRIRITGEETVYSGWSKIIRAQLATPDGGTFSREIEHHGDAVAVLPYDPARRCALMVAAPRAPVIWAGGPPDLIEAPAGMLEDDEPAEACARREAEEEVGVRLGGLEPVAEAWSTPGVSSEKIALFLAPYSEGDRTGEGGGLAAENELIEVLELPLAELWARFEAGAVRDMKTLVLLLALRQRRPELFG